MKINNEKFTVLVFRKAGRCTWYHSLTSAQVTYGFQPIPSMDGLTVPHLLTGTRIVWPSSRRVDGTVTGTVAPVITRTVHGRIRFRALRNRKNYSMR